ncbi:MAG: hypothetical protein WKG07_11895 [Hymenobacter sp.]
MVDLIHLIRRADAQSKGIESGSMDEAEILRELVWLILHNVPAGRAELARGPHAGQQDIGHENAPGDNPGAFLGFASNRWLLLVR